jgi:hypothetical protein
MMTMNLLLFVRFFSRWKYWRLHLIYPRTGFSLVFCFPGGFMSLYCHFCGLNNFRTSLFRFRCCDFARLLILRLPVRCMVCDERRYAFLPHYLRLRLVRPAILRSHG